MSEDRCYHVTVRDDLGTLLWNYQCDMVMCAKGGEGDKLSGVLRIYRTGKRVYDTEWDWRVFGDIYKKDDPYYRYTQKPATGTGETPHKDTNITFAEDDGSPCDTGECDCYMGPIYSVFVGALEFEETRSPAPTEAWEVFLPILERNPGFADFGITLREVEW